MAARLGLVLLVARRAGGGLGTLPSQTVYAFEPVIGGAIVRGS